MRAHDQSSPLDLALLHAHKSCRSQTAAQTVQRTKKLRVALKKRLLAANSVQTTQYVPVLRMNIKQPKVSFKSLEMPHVTLFSFPHCFSLSLS